MMSNNNNRTIEIFQSPARKPYNNTSFRAPTTTTTTQRDNSNKDYVDYTPRRLQVAASPAFRNSNVPNVESNPKLLNSISYARERRSYFYQQLALEESGNEDVTMDSYMDSPAVRRHFGVSDRVAALSDSPPHSNFNERIRQAINLEQLSQ